MYICVCVAKQRAMTTVEYQALSATDTRGLDLFIPLSNLLIIIKSHR